MCARYTYTKDEAKLRLLELLVVFGRVPKDDIRPTDLGPVILPDFQGLFLRWGWTVPWDKKPLINAKSETLTTLGTFKPHLQNRCLLLADGFYEKGIRFIQPDTETFCFAGLWREEAGKRRYTLLTTTPNDTVSPYHNRMPFILRPEQYRPWLGNDWQDVLQHPDKSPLEKIQKQPDLF